MAKSKSRSVSRPQAEKIAALAELALQKPSGITIKFSEPGKAIRFRQIVYATRYALNNQEEDDRSISYESLKKINDIELVLDRVNYDLIIRPSGGLISGAIITDTDTGEEVSLPKVESFTTPAVHPLWTEAYDKALINEYKKINITRLSGQDKENAIWNAEHRAKMAANKALEVLTETNPLPAPTTPDEVPIGEVDGVEVKIFQDGKTYTEGKALSLINPNKPLFND